MTKSMVVFAFSHVLLYLVSMVLIAEMLFTQYLVCGISDVVYFKFSMLVVIPLST